MRKRFYSISSLLTICLCLLFSVQPHPGANAETFQQGSIDPWSEAVAEASNLLADNPDFESHLCSYQELIAELDQYLQLVENSRPALDVIDQLKSTQIPLIGNAWEILVSALETSQPGAGSALEALDSGFRSLLAFREKIADFQDLSPIAQASQVFRSSPSQASLVALRDGCQVAQPFLETLRGEISAFMSEINSVYENFRLAQEGLNLLGSFLGDAIITDAVQTLNDGVNQIAIPLSELIDTTHKLESQIDQDLEVMASIGQIVYDAEHAPPPVPETNGPIIPDADRSNSNPDFSPFEGDIDWMALFLAVVGGAVLILGIIILVSRNRARTVVQVPESGYSNQPVESPRVSTWEKPTAPPIVFNPPAYASLVFVNGPLAGKIIPLIGDDILIGRSSEAQIHPSDPKISRRHARLRYAGGSWYIQDQNSSGGIFVNGQPTPACRLENNDRVTLGGSTFILKLE